MFCSFGARAIPSTKRHQQKKSLPAYFPRIGRPRLSSGPSSSAFSHRPMRPHPISLNEICHSPFAMADCSIWTPYTHTKSSCLHVLLLLDCSPGSLTNASARGAAKTIARQLTNAFEACTRKQPGFRRNHPKGVRASRHFEAIETAHTSRAPACSNSTTCRIGPLVRARRRSSQDDADTSVRSLTLFFIANGDHSAPQ